MRTWSLEKFSKTSTDDEEKKRKFGAEILGIWR
jgi:hypothetical protein